MDATNELEARGFVTVHDVVDASGRARLVELLQLTRLQRAATHPSGIVFAARHLLTTVPELKRELASLGIHDLASRFLGSAAFPVDAAYFDKQSAANWAVPAHQDRVLPVLFDGERKHRVAQGIVVAEPSPTTLARLLAVRIHFDPTDGETGALWVLPGSHATGLIASQAIKQTSLASFVPCAAGTGDVLLMRPLLLHRSSPSNSTGHRRVLHVVYATEEPDDGLRWRRDDDLPATN